MEESSENKKRGRPRRFSPVYVDALTNLEPDIRTERGKQEHIYNILALSPIMDIFNSDPENNRWTEYYIDPNRTHMYHKCILSAIGRIDNEDDIVELAREIAEKKIPTRQAVTYIRNWRAGGEPKPDFMNLLQSFCTFMDNYQVTHPSTPRKYFVSALRQLADSIEEDN